MSTNLDEDFKNISLISQVIKAKQKSKKEKDQQDTESLNTMDYYKDDSSNKNSSLIDESKANNKLLFESNKKEEINKTQDINNKKELSSQKNNNRNKFESKNNDTKNRKYSITINNPQNIQKALNEMHNICSKCHCDLGNNYSNCIICNNIFCKKCFKGKFGKNMYNNKNINDNNKEQDLTENRICQFCRNKNNSKKNNKKNFMTIMFEPLDSVSEAETKYSTETNNNNNININMNLKERNKNEEKIKSLKEKLNEYEEFLNKINDSKIEIEIKKNISLNILQMIKKSIEVEYNKNLNKLNELILKIHKIKEDINNKINNHHIIYNNEVELQINLDTYKNSLNGFFKIFDNYNQKIISRPIFRGYKLYESNNILINKSETYSMKGKEILTDFAFGKVYLKIDRYTNNYINYLNFSTFIKPKNSLISNEIINASFFNEINKKSRFIVNMIVNNKIIKLNKIGKDNNDMNLNYESTEEENRIFFSKDKNNCNNRAKNFSVKIIISEIIL